VNAADTTGLGDTGTMLGGPDGADGAGEGGDASDGSDAGDGGDGGGPNASPCVGAEHWLCDDFDRDGAPATAPYWDPSPTLTDAATLAIVAPTPPAPPSLPNALLAASPATGTDEAQLNKAHAGPAGGLECSLSFRIDTFGGEDAILSTVSLSTGNQDYYRIDLVGSGSMGGVYFRAYGEGPDAAQAPVTMLASYGVTTGQWATASFSVAFATGAEMVGVNGTVASNSMPDLANWPAPDYQTVALGVAPYGGPGSWSVLFDNVFCDFVP
jgi:hypothetical protein